MVPESSERRQRGPRDVRGGRGARPPARPPRRRGGRPHGRLHRPDPGRQRPGAGCLDQPLRLPGGRGPGRRAPGPPGRAGAVDRQGAAGLGRWRRPVRRRRQSGRRDQARRHPGCPAGPGARRRRFGRERRARRRRGEGARRLPPLHRSRRLRRPRLDRPDHPGRRRGDPPGGRLDPPDGADRAGDRRRHGRAGAPDLGRGHAAASRVLRLRRPGRGRGPHHPGPQRRRA